MRRDPTNLKHITDYINANPSLDINDIHRAFETASDKPVLVNLWRLNALPFNPNLLSLREAIPNYFEWRKVYYDNVDVGGAIFEASGSLRTLSFDIFVPQLLRGKGILRETFSKSINFYNPNRLQSDWLVDPVKYADTGGLSSNLIAYRNARQTMSPSAAAFETPSGRLARDNGFTVANVDETDVNHVIVFFTQ